MTEAGGPRPGSTGAGTGPALVVMGVQGCGKSTVGTLLAARLGTAFLDADDLHAPEAKAAMAAGRPLSDADRWPWLAKVADQVAAGAREGGIVIACSALKRSYRDLLRAACPTLRFVYLAVDPGELRARLAGRQGHFMPRELLDSQLRTLQEPAAGEPGTVRIVPAGSAEHTAEAALAALRAAE